MYTTDAIDPLDNPCLTSLSVIFDTKSSISLMGMLIASNSFNSLSIYGSDLLISAAICSAPFNLLTSLIVLDQLDFRFILFYFLIFLVSCYSTWLFNRAVLRFCESELDIILLITSYFFRMFFGPVPRQS